MKRFSVLLPAILCVGLLILGGWKLCGKFEKTRAEIRGSGFAADSIAVSVPDDSLDAKEK